MSIAMALVAAMLVGTGLVFQQQSAEQVPKSYFLHPRLIAELLRKRRWLAGIGIMAAGQGLSMWAIGHLDLTVAEPLLATSLLFALILAVPISGQRLRRSEVLGALLLGAGVTVLSVSRSINSQGIHFGGFAYWWAAAAIAGVAFCFLRAGLAPVRPGPGHADRGRRGPDLRHLGRADPPHGRDAGRTTR